MLEHHITHFSQLLQSIGNYLQTLRLLRCSFFLKLPCASSINLIHIPTSWFNQPGSLMTNALLISESAVFCKILTLPFYLSSQFKVRMPQRKWHNQMTKQKHFAPILFDIDVFGCRNVFYSWRSLGWVSLGVQLAVTIGCPAHALWNRKSLQMGSITLKSPGWCSLV